MAVSTLASRRLAVCGFRRAPSGHGSWVPSRLTCGSISPSGKRCFSRIVGYSDYYGKLKSQEGMLRDVARCEGYRAAMKAAAPKIKDATVLDIGTGSGFLAMTAAQYGARKVYAVEGSREIAGVASRLTRANGFADVVEVIPKLLEDITEDEIPKGSVDVIVSELLSHFLVGELGPQVVTLAKQRFLKPGGLILPAVAALKMSPFEDSSLGAELRNRHSFWNQHDFYGIDLTPALKLAVEQQMRETVLDIVDADSLLVPADVAPASILDMSAPNSPSAWKRLNFELEFPHMPRDAVIDGLCGWFDLIFQGAGDGPAPVLSTSPAAPDTVWAQCRFMLDKPMAVKAAAKLTAICELRVDKARESYTLRIELRNHTTNAVARAGPIRLSDVYARHLAQAQPFPKEVGPAGDGSPS